MNPQWLILANCREIDYQSGRQLREPESEKQNTKMRKKEAQTNGTSYRHFCSLLPLYKTKGPVTIVETLDHPICCL